MPYSVFKSVLSASIGNVLEWYEYTLYAYFATVISTLFFPAEDRFVGMMLTFATFAVGLAARPIGGIIFGYIGDRYSRKQAMALSILFMSIPTLCIGILPTYAQIGIWAPIILVSLRIIQGVALGGEFGSSCVYLFESVPKNKRGFLGSMALTGVGLGLVLSSCTILLVESWVSKETVLAYAWRIPFFISVLGSFVGFYMRKSLLETPEFAQEKARDNLVTNPFFELMRNHKKTLLFLFSIFLTTQVSFFVVFIFGKSMMIDFLHYDSATAGKFNLFTVMSYTVATFIFGYFSDRFDKRVMILVGVLGLLGSAFTFIRALQGGDFTTILCMCLLLGALIGIAEGILNPLVAESFPTNIRATAVSFCCNFTSVAFGGAAPMIAMALIERQGGVHVVAIYLTVVCVISALSLFASLLRPTYEYVLDTNKKD